MEQGETEGRSQQWGDDSISMWVSSSEEAAAKLEQKYNEVQKEGGGMKTRR